MRRRVFVLVVALAAGAACGKYGPPVRTVEAGKPAAAQPDTEKSQDPNKPPPDSNAPEPGPMP